MYRQVFIDINVFTDKLLIENYWSQVVVEVKELVGLG